jgi:hypothetical protein
MFGRGFLSGTLRGKRDIPKDRGPDGNKPAPGENPGEQSASSQYSGSSDRSVCFCSFVLFFGKIAKTKLTLKRCKRATKRFAGIAGMNLKIC